MIAALFNGKDLTIQEVEIPKLTKNQVLIKLKAVGLCGTDLAIIEGHLPTPTPIIIGHELAGEIVDVGDDVDKSWLGKRVVSEINSNIDFSCYYCKQHIFTQCISRKALGIDINGALAEYIAVEAYLIHEIPTSISYSEATFIEPLAAAYQTFEMMPIDEGDKTVAIFGLGKLGLLIMQIALHNNLKVIAVDGSEEKLALAKKFGASRVINRLKENSISYMIQEYTEGLGADIVIDTSGNPDALREIVSSCRTRGKIHIKSTHGFSTPINLTDLVVREITIYTSRCGPFEKAIEGLKSKEISVKELIFKEFSLRQIKDAFDSYRKNRNVIKIIIKI